LRDEGALESAMASAKNRAYYENADIAICAATYAYHLTQAHAFIDGNKRIAAAISEIFLEINDVKLNATNEQIVDLFLSIASEEKTRNDIEQIFFQWIS
jgi:death-on-curing protein